MNFGQLENLENLFAEIRRVSFADDKTSLGNALALEQEERLINDGKSKFDVIVFGDLNNFKRINDDHTHDAGDLAIRVVGETIRKIVMEDLEAEAYRQSGDEFVILLRQEFIERFLSSTSSFGNINFSHKDKELKTAMSFGYARSDGKTSFRDLLERAEVACQHAKVQGDGACVEWTENIKLNPLVRIAESCKKCGAKITCNISRQNAPAKLICCPCCGESL
jgi:diguanylate cyclase (GGDEF)-like protein